MRATTNMYGESLRILVVEDNSEDAETIRRAIDVSLPCRSKVTWADGIAAAREVLLEVDAHVLILSLFLSENGGVETYRALRQLAGDAAVLVVTSAMDRSAGLEAVAEGADDCLIKGSISLDRIGDAVLYALLKKRVAVNEQRDAEARRLEAVARLGSGIAHHFNNLAAINMGYTMQMLGRDDLPPGVRKGLERILEASRRSAMLTRHLLEFTKSGGHAKGVVDASSMLPGLQTLIRGILPSTVELEMDHIAADCWVRILPVDFEQILLTLTMNARDAMPEGGRLSISLARVEPRVEHAHADLPSAQVVLTVCDTGRGMPPEVEQRALEPFFTTKEVGAAGLGLPAIHGIVRQASGFVAVRSAPGWGTTIRIHMPLAERPAEAI